MEEKYQDGTLRENIKVGYTVEVIQKPHQRSGQQTTGVVKRILTSSPKHTRGIKVMLEDGIVGRVQKVLEH